MPQPAQSKRALQSQAPEVGLISLLIARLKKDGSLLFRNRVSLCSSVVLQLTLDQAGLELSDLPDAGIKVCATPNPPSSFIQILPQGSNSSVSTLRYKKPTAMSGKHFCFCWEGGSRGGGWEAEGRSLNHLCLRLALNFRSSCGFLSVGFTDVYQYAWPLPLYTQTHTYIHTHAYIHNFKAYLFYVYGCFICVCVSAHQKVSDPKGLLLQIFIICQVGARN